MAEGQKDKSQGWSGRSTGIARAGAGEAARDLDFIPSATADWKILSRVQKQSNL